MQTNEIVVFRHRGAVHIGRLENVVGKKYRIATGRNRLYEILPDRIVFATGTVTENGLTLEEFKHDAGNQSRDIELRDVWELTREESEGFSHVDIAELHWPQPISSVQHAGMILHLERDCPYFAEHDSEYRPLDDDKVTAHFQRIEKKQEALVEEEAVLQWLNSDDCMMPEDFSNRQLHALTRIQQFAMQGEEYEQSSQAKALLQSVSNGAEGNPQKRAFRLMVRKGVWDEDEHLDLIRYEVPVDFEPEVLQGAAEVQTDESDREDLTGLQVFSIDDEKTQDVDDAISLETLESGYRVGVHITDVSAIVERNSAVDQAARERTTSLYFPGRHIPMLPSELSHGHCSLLQESRRCAVSYLFDFDGEFNLTDERIVPSVIVNRNKLSYDAVNQILASDDHSLGDGMRNLNLIADALFAQRMDAGAVELERVELSVRVDKEKNISVSTRTGHSQADHIVSELMILTNVATARFFHERQVPAIYRTQAEPDFSDLDDGLHESVKRYRMIRKIRPMALSVEAKPHAMLGAAVYCQATSPIRRYSDLLLQRQLVSVLRDDPPCYSRDELTDEVSLIERSRDLRKVWSRREWYWFVKFMKQDMEKVHRVVVLEVRDRDLVVELLEYGTRLNMKQAGKAEAGDEFSVQVKQADPWDGLLRLAPISAEKDESDHEG